MNLAELKTSHYRSQLRAALEAAYARHGDLDYRALFTACTDRGEQLWREVLVPELGAERAAAFDKALWRVRMRPETSIPWPMGFGYAFGAACHALAGGRGESRAYAATTAGLANFLVGLFDYLLDKHPREFGTLGELVSDDALRRYTLDRDLSTFVVDSAQTLAAGLVALYRLYLQRCHHQLGDANDAPMARAWSNALRQVHDAERQSVSWRISKVPPTAAMIEQSETPGVYAYWMIAVVACLDAGDAGLRRMEPFARRLIRFMRLVDTVVDIEDDIRNDLWGGAVARIALEAHNQQDADRIVREITEECVQLLDVLQGEVASLYWDAGDAFSLADILWAFVWTGAGGQIPGWRDKGLEAIERERSAAATASD